MNINTHLIVFITGTYVDVVEVSKFFRSTESSCGGTWFGSYTTYAKQQQR
jgi:hypothetical protein